MKQANSHPASQAAPVADNRTDSAILSTQPVLAGSPFARVSLLAYLCLILYASWYPFTGWRANKLSALSEVIRQWPRYWTWFDASVNVVGYIPFGVLIVFACYPRIPRWWAALLACLGGATVSATAELVQYFLPSRVTSLLDFLTNSGGAMIGALLGAMLTPLILEKGRLQLLRKQWTYQESSRELLILGLWPMAQLYPQAYLFGLGQIMPSISRYLSDWFDLDVDLSNLILPDVDFNAEAYLLAEAMITALGATGALLLCLSILNRHAPKISVSALLMLLALAGKTLASALLYQPEYAFSWLTPGAIGGLLISLIMLYGFSFAPLQVQKRLAALALSIALLVLNLLPDNPYFEATMQNWVQGQFLNFNGAAQFLSLIWPFLAIWVLLRKPKPISRH